MADYPGTLPTFTTKTNKVDLVDAAHINTLQSELLAGLTELGVNPAGSVTDVVTRLAVSLSNSGALRQGTTLPTTGLESGLPFFKTDVDVLNIRNGNDDGWIELGGPDMAYIRNKSWTGSGSGTETLLDSRTDWNNKTCLILFQGRGSSDGGEPSAPGDFDVYNDGPLGGTFAVNMESRISGTDHNSGSVIRFVTLGTTRIDELELTSNKWLLVDSSGQLIISWDGSSSKYFKIGTLMVFRLSAMSEN